MPGNGQASRVWKGDDSGPVSGGPLLARLNGPAGIHQSLFAVREGIFSLEEITSLPQWPTGRARSHKPTVFPPAPWLLFLFIVVAAAAAGCGSGVPDGGRSGNEILVASTTSTRDSGLFAVLVPAFEKVYPQYRVKVNAVGTGEALKLGERCDVDVVLVHAPDAEREFVANGYGAGRREVMYNDFIIVGPSADPAVIGGGRDAAAAFQKIAAAAGRSGAKFVSRGDDSGTHKMEMKLWQGAGTDKPAGSWYRSAGQGMGEVLTIAHETGAYTLTDRGTWLSMHARWQDMTVMVEGDRALFNQYGVIPVNPERCPQANAAGAQALADWLVSAAGQRLIGEFGREEYGQALFVPNAR